MEEPPDRSVREIQKNPARKTQKRNPIGQFPFFVMRFQKE